MPLRRRLTVVAAVAVAVAVALVALVAYLAVASTLRGQVDDQLHDQATRTQVAVKRPAGLLPRLELRAVPALPARRGGAAPYVQLIRPDGKPSPMSLGDVPLPVDAQDRVIAMGQAGPRLTDVHVDGTHLRLLTVPLPGGGAVQFARSLGSIDSVLARLRLILLLVCLGGVALAVVLGRLVSRNVVAPIKRVSEAAAHIERTEDLGRRIEVTSQDEVGELASRFNAMLDTLERSIGAQRQLVADASHELRTPVTSLRTNIEVLADGDALAEEERRRLIADVQEQAEELGTLVADVIELARGEQPCQDTEDVRLDALVEEALARARRHAPDVRFEADLHPAVVDGTPDRLARAVNNLLDNAARHSPPGGVVEVAAGPEGVRVRDHGDGIAPEDLPHLFDRFYRGASARGLPGTGLGLAIVKQVADQHGGSVQAANAVDGGAEFTLALPGMRYGQPAWGAGAAAVST